MEDITAIILAAGQGVRMGRRGQLIPKGLLKLGDKTLVEDMILCLQQYGIKNIRIITGHLAEMYQELFAENNMAVALKHNPHFANTGSLNSLLAGLEGIEGPTLILESDLTFEPRALEPIDEKVSSLVLSGPTGAGDEVYVWTKTGNGQKGHLADMSKNLHALSRKFYGELVGITCFSASDTKQMRSLATTICAENPAADYEVGLVALARQSDMVCQLIDDLAWAEIDDEAMYDHALNIVFPSIQKARSQTHL